MDAAAGDDRSRRGAARRRGGLRAGGADAGAPEDGHRPRRRSSPSAPGRGRRAGRRAAPRLRAPRSTEPRPSPAVARSTRERPGAASRAPAEPSDAAAARTRRRRSPAGVAVRPRRRLRARVTLGVRVARRRRGDVAGWTSVERAGRQHGVRPGRHDAPIRRRARRWPSSTTGLALGERLRRGRQCALRSVRQSLETGRAGRDPVAGDPSPARRRDQALAGGARSGRRRASQSTSAHHVVRNAISGHGIASGANAGPPGLGAVVRARRRRCAPRRRARSRRPRAARTGPTISPGATISPVSSSVSRTAPSVAVSSTSRKPPGWAHQPAARLEAAADQDDLARRR